MQTPRRHVALRVPVTELERIDQLAEGEGLTRTAYMIRASLGELDLEPSEDRFNALEIRVMRKERQLGTT